MFSDGFEPRAINTWKHNDILGQGWKWSTLSSHKVRKKGGASMEIHAYDDTIVYTASRSDGLHGKWNIQAGNLLLYKMIALTHYEKELQYYIKKNHDIN